MKNYIVGVQSNNRFEFSMFCLENNLNHYSINNTPFPASTLYRISAEEKDLTAMKLKLPFKVHIFDGVEYAA